MANYAYFIVLAATVVVPLVLSMVPWRLRWSAVEWRRLMRVFAFVSVPFVLLDMYSYARGWWAYNPHFVIDARMGGLPIEEIMFFFVVPFACLYLFSAFTKAAGDEPLQRPWIWRLALSLIMVAAIGLAIIEPKERTLFDAVFFVLVGLTVFVMPPKRTAVLWLVAVVGLFLSSQYGTYWLTNRDVRSRFWLSVSDWNNSFRGCSLQFQLFAAMSGCLVLAANHTIGSSGPPRVIPIIRLKVSSALMRHIGRPIPGSVPAPV